jgi:TPR repeat protein
LLILLLSLSGAGAADLYVGRAAQERGDHTTAIRELRPLAQAGDAEAQFLLGRVYESETPGVEDPVEAAVWFGRAAELGHLGAQFRLGRLLEEGRGQPPDMEQALDWYRKAAQSGYVKAQTHLGRLYEEGDGVGQDLEYAIRWYRKAAISGGAEARYRLALIYGAGRGVPQDPGKAAGWMKKAARLGHAEAQYELARMFEEGRGVKLNSAKAHEWYARSAQQGHPAAERKLAAPSSAPATTGDPATDALAPGVPAAAGAVVAATPTNEASRTEPAVEPSASPGTAPDDVTSDVTSSVAPGAPDPSPSSEMATGAAAVAASGAATSEPPPPEITDPEEQYRLAHMYSSGDGRPLDGAQAEIWYLRAAEQGHDLAIYHLALLYWRGRGGSGRKEHVNAHVWFSIAAERGVGDAGEWRDKVAGKMTRKEREASERLIEEKRENPAGAADLGADAE